MNAQVTHVEDDDGAAPVQRLPAGVVSMEDDVQAPAPKKFENPADEYDYRNWVAQHSTPNKDRNGAITSLNFDAPGTPFTKTDDGDHTLTVDPTNWTALSHDLRGVYAEYAPRKPQGAGPLARPDFTPTRSQLDEYALPGQRGFTSNSNFATGDANKQAGHYGSDGNYYAADEEEPTDTERLMTHATKLAHQAHDAISDGFEDALNPDPMAALDNAGKTGMAALKGMGEMTNKTMEGINIVGGSVPVLYDTAKSMFTGKNTTEAQDAWFSSAVDPLIHNEDAYELAKNAGLTEKAAKQFGSALSMISTAVLTGGEATPVAAGASGLEAAGAAGTHAAKAMAIPAMSDAIDTGRKVLDATGDKAAALKAAQVQYLVTTAQGVVPASATGNLATRAATGAVSGVATGEAGRTAMNTVLPDNMQTPFTAEGAGMEAVGGGLFGAIAGPGKPRATGSENAGQGAEPQAPVGEKPFNVDDLPKSTSMGGGLPHGLSSDPWDRRESYNNYEDARKAATEGDTARFDELRRKAQADAVNAEARSQSMPQDAQAQTDAKDARQFAEAGFWGRYREQADTNASKGETKPRPGETEGPKAETKPPPDEPPPGAAGEKVVDPDKVRKVVTSADAAEDVRTQKTDKGTLILAHDLPVVEVPDEEAKPLVEAAKQRLDERRLDVSTRKNIDEMTPEEMRTAITQLRQGRVTDPLTGLANKTAFAEDEASPTVAHLDMDGFKAINDLGGHDNGDLVLQAVAKVLHEESVGRDGVKVYRTGGDEFKLNAPSPEVAHEVASRINARLKSHAIRLRTADGNRLTVRGLGLSYGIGRTSDEAETNLQQHKTQRAAQGTRPARGELPPGSTITAPPAGRTDYFDNGRTAAQEIAPNGERPKATVLGREVEKPDRPTEAQKVSGKYFKPRVEWHDEPIRVENVSGQYRSGKDERGRPWKSRMKDADYGYFEGTKANDGDGVDVFMGKHQDDGKAYVVDQLDRTGKKFDEHKVIVHVNGRDEAKDLYMRHYEAGWKGFGGMTEMEPQQLKRWLEHDDHTGPVDRESVPAEKVVRGKGSDPKHDSVLEYLARHERGIDKEEAEAQGIDKADMNLPQAYVGIRRAFRKSGMSFDHAAETLHQEGYPVADEQGHYNPNTLLDLLSRELAGHKVYSSANESQLPDGADLRHWDRPTEEELSKLSPEGLDRYQEDIERELKFRTVIPEGDEVPFARPDDFQLTSPGGKAGEQAKKQPASKYAQVDLFGDDVALKNELKRIEAEKDKRRNAGQESTETGKPGDLFSQARNQTEIKEADAAKYTGIEDRKRKGGTAPGQLDIFASASNPKPVEKAIASFTRKADLSVNTKLTQSGTFRTGHRVIDSWEKAASVIAPLRKLPQEHMTAIVLDKARKPLAVIMHSVGRVADASVETWSLVGAINQVPGAHSVYFAHNHPSGNKELSGADRIITGKLGAAMQGSGVLVHGMLVVGGKHSEASFVPYVKGDAMMGIDQATRQIPPAGRDKMPVPVMVRRMMAIKASNPVIGREVVGPYVARHVVRSSGIASGALLLDTHHRVVGVMALTQHEMARLRTGLSETGSSWVIRHIAQANASAIIPFGHVIGVRNMQRFANAHMVKALDGVVIGDDGNSWKSTAETGEGENGDNFFARGAGNGSMTAGDVEAHIHGQLAKFANQPPGVHVFDSFADAMKDPTAAKALAGQDPDNVTAWTDPKTGHLNFIADKVKGEAHLDGLIAHEYMSHYGIRAMLPTEKREEYDNILHGMTQAAPADFAKRGRQEYGDAFNPENQAHAARAAEETMAYFNQRYLAGQDLPSRIRRWLDKLHAMLRDWWDKFRGAPQKYDALWMKKVANDLEDYLRRGTRGSPGVDRGEPAFARKAPMFYSGLERAVDAAKRDKGTGAEWEATLKNMPGVKPEEVDWVDLKSFLEGKGRVTKQEVADYVRSHAAEIKQVTHQKGVEKRITGDELQNDVDTARDRLNLIARGHQLGVDFDEDNGHAFAFNKPDGTYIAADSDNELLPQPVRDALLAHIDALVARQINAEYPEYGEVSPRYSQYTLHGEKENYREHLLAMPDSRDADYAAHEAKITALSEKVGELGFKFNNAEYDFQRALNLSGSDYYNAEHWIRDAVSFDRGRAAGTIGQEAQNSYFDKLLKLIDKHSDEDPDGVAMEHLQKALDLQHELQKAQDDYQQTKLAPVDVKRGYTSPHWGDVRNIVAHIRSTARQDVEGKKLHFIEEIQSDMHQTGRRHGYEDPKAYERMKEIERIGAQMGTQRDPVTNRMVNEGVWHRLRAEREALARTFKGQVPDAPFKKSWPLLAFKAALRHAVEAGADRVAWTTGDQQAKRYSLANHVKVRYAARGVDQNGTPLHYVIVRHHEDEGRREPMHEMRAATPDKIREVLGQEITQMILNGEGVEQEHSGTHQSIIERGKSSHVEPVNPFPPHEIRELAKGGHALVFHPGDPVKMKIMESAYGKTKEDVTAHRDELLNEHGDYNGGWNIVFKNGEKHGVYPTRHSAMRTADEIDAMVDEPKEKLLQGDDLRVGGSGMRTFYDKMLPSEVGKYVKKWGTKVGSTDIKTGEINDHKTWTGPDYTHEEVQERLQDKELLEDNPRLYGQLQDVATLMRQGQTFKQAIEHEGVASSALATRLGGTLLNEYKPPEAVHSVDITDAMRADILQGQPLFARPDDKDQPKDERAFLGRPGVLGKTYDLGRRAVMFPATNQLSMDVRKILNPRSYSEMSKLAANRIVPFLADLARQKEIALARLEAFSREVDKLSYKEQLQAYHEAETGQSQSNPKMQPIMDALQKMLRDKAEQVQAMGPGHLDNFIENYLPHYYTDESKAKKFFAGPFGRRPLRGPATFKKQRYYATLREAMEKGGLTPLTANPLIQSFLKLYEMDRYMSGVSLLRDGLTPDGLATYFPLSKKIPDGWKEIDDPSARISSWSEAEGAFVPRGRYAMPEDAARLLNNHLGVNHLANFSPAMTLRALANSMTMFQLGFSGFHVGFTSTDAIVSKTALGYERLMNGEPGRAAAAFLESFSGPVGVLMNLSRGRQLQRAYLNPRGATPELQLLANAFVGGGGRIRMPVEYQTAQGISPFHGVTVMHLVGDLKKVMNDPQASVFDYTKTLGSVGLEYAHKYWRTLTDMARTTPVWQLPFEALGRVVRASTGFIMEKIVPWQKQGVFVDMARDYLRRNPGASPTELNAEMQRITHSIDNRLGEVVYDNNFWNRAFKMALHLSLRAVGWRFGTLQELGGGAHDFLKAADTLLRTGKLTPKDFTHKMAYLMGLMTLQAISGALLQYLMTGEAPKDLKDVMFPRTGYLRKDGSPERLSLPTYVKDMYGYLTQPGHEVASMLNPILGELYYQIQNADYFGDPIYDPDDNGWGQFLERSEHFVKAYTPFVVQGTQHLEAAQQPGVVGALARVGNFFGLKPVPKSIANPQSVTEREHYEDEKRYEKKLRYDLRAAREAGDKDKVREIQRRLQQGKQESARAHSEYLRQKAEAARRVKQQEHTSGKTSQLLDAVGPLIDSSRSRSEMVAKIHAAGYPALAGLIGSLPDNLRPLVARRISAQIQMA